MKVYKTLVSVLLVMGLMMLAGCDNSTDDSTNTTNTVTADSSESGSSSQSGDASSSASDSSSQSDSSSSSDDDHSADQTAADAVIAKINAIGEVAYTTECKTKIDNARDAYEALTETQKLLVTNYAVLTAAEARYKDLMSVYTVYFNANGGTGTMTDLTADEGDSITLTANAFTKTGYKFSHWNDASDDSGIKYDDNAAILDLSKDITLYAQWTAEHYLITLSNDGDVSGDATLDAVYDSVLPSLNVLPSKVGCAFGGYFSDADGKGTQYIDANGEPTSHKWTIAANTTLYAMFIKAEAGKTICYDDGTYSPLVVAGKTPVGIAIALDESGRPTKMVHLNQIRLKWCINQASAYSMELNTSETDGSGNWGVICDAVDDETADGHYPAFEYVNGLTEYGGDWYIPAKDELNQIYMLMTEINSALYALSNAGVTAYALWGAYYLSSSAVDNYYWCQDFRTAYQGKTSRDTSDHFVRAVRAF